MRPDLLSEVLERLKANYALQPKGAWLRQGKCPGCGKKELYANAEGPWVVRCGRIDKCGYNAHVKTLFPDLFDNWSERYKPTETNPTASADAYLAHARHLNLTQLRGSYSQEQFYSRDIGAGSATVRFALPGGGWWERLIDQPHRFGKMKARFAAGSSYQGEWWQPPSITLDALVAAEELWIVEGIFDAQSLVERGIVAVSAMSCNNYPEAALARVAAACGAGARPRLIWAYDANKAGRTFIKKNVKRAADAGWSCGAALTDEKQASKPRDWNDLHMLDSAETPLFDADALETYRWNGDVLCAPTAIEKAKLVALRHGWSGFTVEHGVRTWWASVNEARVAELVGDMSADPSTAKMPAKDKRAIAIDDAMSVTEIANCVAAPLYFQFDDIAQEGAYYFQIDFPSDIPSEKKLVTAGQVVNGPDFGKRLAAISPAAVWSGGTHHLLQMRKQWTGIRSVRTVYITGYDKKHEAYLFPDHAVKDGKVYPINDEDYFDIGKLAIKPTGENVLTINWDGKDYEAQWPGPLWRTFGVRGMVAMAFWFGTLFADQIRAKQQSWPFIEIHGEAGGGKSTIIEFLWRLLGRADYEGFDPSKSTAAARARNLGKVGNLPVVLIESDRSADDRQHSKQFDWDELKTAYNGRSVRSRGVANGGMDTFEPPFRGAIAIAQNEPVNASLAIMERIVSLQFSKAMQTPASRKAIDQLLAFDTETLSAFIIEATRREPEILPAYFAAYAVHERALTASGITRNIRLIKNHAQLLAAFDALRLIIELPDDVVEATAKFITDMCGERHTALSADHPMVQEFWEKFDYLRLSEDENAIATLLNHSRDPNLIAISLAQFEERCAQRRLQLPPMVELKRHLKTSKTPKFIASKTVNSCTGKTLHCWVFQIAVPTNPNATRQPAKDRA